MRLPPDTNVVRARGRTYFYYHPGRGTANAGKSVPLGSDPTLLWENWRKASAAPAATAPVARGKTFADMYEAFKASPEWKAYSDNTRRDYAFYLDKMKQAWGAVDAGRVSAPGVLEARDAMADSPGSANHMLVVGKTIYKWGIPRGFAAQNPFREIAALKVEDDGHRPWPDWALDCVMETAWDDLRRFLFLAIETGQRESDVVRMGPDMREGRGLWIRPQKTRRRRKAFFCPLTTAANVELDRWGETPLRFVTGRWGKKVEIPTGEFYVLSPAGNPYTPEGLRSRWNRWLETDAGRALLERWGPWELAQRKRYGEELEDGAAYAPTLHGLRSTAVCKRKLAGYTNNAISNEIGMSLSMVERYARFIDQKHAAETNIVALDGGVDRRRRNAL